MKARSARVLLVGLALLTLAGCEADSHSPRTVAERFINQHYVRIDLVAAEPFCTGLALKKLQDEQRLTQGQVIDESTRKPTVRYRLIEHTDDAVRPTFVFEGTISVDGAGEFKRKWLITTRRDGDTWKVSNFEEFD